ncbi:uncharacterized protein EI90DRAFT_3196733 [Cantharellus anzutake]|uniref:uncharacterized protein n=1 Tax=Cantharellus anzutake TaxID=1750568 RepID=UPI001908E814|nr:uncharacterized protein EI90DRAFT_3196733 [Cantharellus anzutake]KAF8331698.1 hypothetical protein EI90DRAFT_3196733 [Cantharellus anzutake]
MEPRRVTSFPPALQRADSMHESAYGSMTNSNAGDASIGQPNLDQIGVSTVSLGPVDPPDTSKTSPELTLADFYQLLKSDLVQMETRLSESQDRIERRLTAVEERQNRRLRRSQNVPVPLELSQPNPILPQPVPCQVESSPAPADCKLAEACSASASPEPLPAHTVITGSGTVPDPIQCHPQPVLDQVENSPAPVERFSESGTVPDPTRSSLPPVGPPFPEPRREFEFLENSALAVLASAIFLKPSRNTGLHHLRSADTADQLPSYLKGDRDSKDRIKS